MPSIPAAGPLSDKAVAEDTTKHPTSKVTKTDDGFYHCAACNAPLFASGTKFESGSGWPSFFDPISKDAVQLHEDNTFGMRRVEVTCATCGGHLGHVFPDGPREHGGQRFCINSASLAFEKK
jgi:peptide-methionine (R)-S-oxide reductase